MRPARGVRGRGRSLEPALYARGVMRGKGLGARFREAFLGIRAVRALMLSLRVVTGLNMI
jgi:hypothetical protein